MDYLTCFDKRWQDFKDINLVFGEFMVSIELVVRDKDYW